MAAVGGKRERARARLVYVPRFGSRQRGGVLLLSGRRAEGQAGGSQEEPRGAAAGAAGSGELPPGFEPEVPAAPSAARASSARSGGQSASGAGLTQKTLAKTFDFPIPFNEASKIMKKKKKVSAWKKVHKVISRMLEENEKYRLRLKCQQLSSESSDYTR
ncbi:uncharacterized protein C5orf47 homolog [Saccopteryx bilineata]|uniref:uncharacterized protein C5orf47 homolog n=1 Tax=Saccopteryx bilineata TaxID=59482 RepID=UPI00338E3391